MVRLDALHPYPCTQSHPKPEMAVQEAHTEAHHANVGERLAFLEKAIGDSAEKHAQDELHL